MLHPEELAEEFQKGFLEFSPSVLISETELMGDTHWEKEPELPI